MNYLQNALSLIDFIQRTNESLLKEADLLQSCPNRMWLKRGDGSVQNIEMDEFSNDFVVATLQSSGPAESFIITDRASMDVKGKEFNYILYKAYHMANEKGVVFYQGIDNNSPVGTLQFSNMEDNIFFPLKAPEGEESSCNAMETDKSSTDGKHIVFLIGHYDEKRLVYDIQRLIFDTVNNVTRHPKLNFLFTLQINLFEGTPSEVFTKRMEFIEDFTKQKVCREYPNTSFDFVFGDD